MPGHLLTSSTTTLRRAGNARTCGAVAFAISHILAACLAVADECPDTSLDPPESKPVVEATSPDDPIDFVADSFEATKDGDYLLQGPVSITQGSRRISTRDARYNPQTQTFRVEDGVTYTDPNLTVRGRGAQIEPGAGATFEQAEFELPSRSARGSAERIKATASGDLELDSVRYTTCPIGNDDWLIRASDIDLSQRRSLGTGRGVRLDFKGVPILYVPIFSFPLGNERKSGFLYPTFDLSGRSGTGITVPWYWNIAPNYDATFEPAYFSKRGFKLGTEFRYLTEIGRGVVDAQYLPDDQEFGDTRSLIHFTNQSDFTRRLRLNLDAANASDSDWFEDFGSGPEGTSVLYLNRSADLVYLTDHWRAIARAQNYQTIDDTIAPDSRPHTILPQVWVGGRWPQLPFGVTLGLDMEVSNFEHNYADTLATLPTGVRFDVAPEISMPLRGGAFYLEPMASWRYTSYQLDETTTDEDDSPSRAAPILSLDGGVTFERSSGSRQQRLQTFEPRFKYLYVPLREQDQLPVFDTAPADLNMVQLFRTNRFVGADRLSNANQLTVGVTSRLLDAETGRQFLSATVGQSYYFDEPEVFLPDETFDDAEVSDLIAEVEVKAFSNWNVRMGLQWDPGETRSEKGDVYFRYQPDNQRVMNLGYRFRRDVIEQVDGSVAWPVSDKWAAYGRLVYSLEDRTAIDQFAGIEYRSCCWRLRAVARRSIRSRDGDTDTNFMLQLELNGLSSVGNVDAFLEGSIQGYSFTPSTPQGKL